MFSCWCGVVLVALASTLVMLVAYYGGGVVVVIVVVGVGVGAMRGALGCSFW